MCSWRERVVVQIYIVVIAENLIECRQLVAGYIKIWSSSTRYHSLSVSSA